MTRDFLDRFAEVVVHCVDALLLLVSGDRAENAVILSDFADTLADLSAVGNLLGDDIHCTGYSLVGTRDALLLVDEFRGVVTRAEALFLLYDFNRERLKTLLLRYARARLSLRAERAVDILELAESLRLFESGGDLVGELLLRLDQIADLLSALVKTAQVI